MFASLTCATAWLATMNVRLSFPPGIPAVTNPDGPPSAINLGTLLAVGMGNTSVGGEVGPEGAARLMLLHGWR